MPGRKRRDPLCRDADCGPVRSDVIQVQRGDELEPVAAARRAAPVSAVRSSSATSRMVGLAGNASLHTLTWPGQPRRAGVAAS